MPHPNDKAKASGDVHPPEVEDANAAEDPSQEDEARPGKGENQAGFLKDQDSGDNASGSRTR